MSEETSIFLKNAAHTAVKSSLAFRGSSWWYVILNWCISKKKKKKPGQQTSCGLEWMFLCPPQYLEPLSLKKKKKKTKASGLFHRVQSAGWPYTFLYFELPPCAILTSVAPGAEMKPTTLSITADSKHSGEFLTLSKRRMLTPAGRKQSVCESTKTQVSVCHCEAVFVKEVKLLKAHPAPAHYTDATNMMTLEKERLVHQFF